MALKENSAEGGTSGMAITAGSQTAGSSGDQLSRGGTPATLEFSNAHPAHGSLGYHYVYSSSAAATLYWAGYTATSMATRCYRYLPAFPSVTTGIMGIYGSSGLIAAVYVMATGALLVTDAAGTSRFNSGSNILSVNTQYRFELVAIPGSTTSNGTINFATYAGDSVTAISTLSMAAPFTTANTGTAAITNAQFGKLISNASTHDDYMDDLAVNDGATTFIGPVAANQAPTANAGPDQTGVADGTLVTLNGTGSSDPDGTIASYVWTQTAGTTVTLSSSSAASPTFTAPSGSAQTLTFSLVVTDNGGAISAADTVNVTTTGLTAILKQNTAEGGSDGTAITANSQTGGASGDQLSIGGNTDIISFSSAHPAHGSLGYKISHTSGHPRSLYWTGYTATQQIAIRSYQYLSAIPSVTTCVCAVANTSGGILFVYLNANGTVRVSDASGAANYTSTATLSATTMYRFEASVDVGTTTSNGTINFAVYAGDSATAIATYTATTLNTGAGASILTVAFGQYITSTATYDAYMDDLAAQAGSTAFIGPYVASDISPIVSAGSNQAGIEPYSTVTLAGTDSDSDGTVVSRAWTQTAGSPSVTLAGATTATATYTAPGTINGTTLTFGYQVTDNQGAASSQSTVTNGILPVTERGVISGSEVPLHIMTTAEVAASQPANYNQIGVIGDSLTLMNNNGPSLITGQLTALGWSSGDIQVEGVYGMKIAAESGSPQNSTGDIITSWRAGGFDPRVWVMATGINDQFAGSAPYDSIRQAAVQQIYNQIMAGPQTDYVIYWIGFDFYDTAYSREPEATAFDQTLLGFQTTYSNFHACSILNYYAPLRSNPGWSSWWDYPTDEVHNTDLGYQTVRAPFYAQVVASEAP